MSLTETLVGRNTQVERPSRWSDSNAKHWKSIQTAVVNHSGLWAIELETLGWAQLKDDGNLADLAGCRGV